MVRRSNPGVRGQVWSEERCPSRDPIDNQQAQSITPQIKCDRVLQGRAVDRLGHRDMPAWTGSKIAPHTAMR
jgi:hypothetical protein